MHTLTSKVTVKQNNVQAFSKVCIALKKKI